MSEWFSVLCPMLALASAPFVMVACMAGSYEQERKKQQKQLIEQLHAPFEARAEEAWAAEVRAGQAELRKRIAQRKRDEALGGLE